MGGTTFSTKDQLQKHIEFTANQERIDGSGDNPHDITICEDVESEGEFKQSILDYWEEHDIEVLCIMEGVDAATSTSIQARHSYTIDDMVWDHEFAQCVFT